MRCLGEMQWSPRYATDFLVADESGTKLYRCLFTKSKNRDAPSTALAYDLIGRRSGSAFVCFFHMLFSFFFFLVCDSIDHEFVYDYSVRLFAL